MKTKIIVLMLVVGLLIGSNQTSAQVGSFLKDKAINALNKGTKKSNETEKKQKDTLHTQQPKPQTQQQSNSNPANSFMQQKMMGMMGLNNVKYDMNYNFTSSMSMEMQATDSLGKKSDKIFYTNYFDKNSRNFAMEFEGADKQSGKKQKSLMIFDYKNWAMLILGDKENNEKSGIAMQMAKDTSVEAQQKKPVSETHKDLSSANMHYKATGRTKIIAGYSCKEYVYENTEGKGEIWATNDVVFDYSTAYGHMAGMQTLATGGTGYGLGTMMEMHFKSLRSKSQTDLVVTDIKPSNPKSFNLTGYQIIGMGGQPGQGKEKKKK